MNTAIASQYARRPEGFARRRARSAFFGRLAAALKAVQYARMVSVLHRLSDSQLVSAGLRRRDIPEHARRLIYSDD